MHSMEGHHMEMGAHMKMTALRTAQPGDAGRAQQVADAARGVMEKYKDYHVALNEGFKIFHPELPQKQYHFTNYRYAMEAAFKFNPEHPTSLLYEKSGDDYRLAGVMYTAPKHFTEDDLNQRIPLSIAQWHQHVNFCAAPHGRKQEMLGPNPKFGLKGSITTQTECDANGGEFHPVIFNWMVHLYPLEKDAARIWSVDRQHAESRLRQRSRLRSPTRLGKAADRNRASASMSQNDASGAAPVEVGIDYAAVLSREGDRCLRRGQPGQRGARENRSKRGHTVSVLQAHFSLLPSPGS